jgi:hypothetical protein
MELSKFVNVYKNKKNNQIKLEIKKNVLKERNIDIKDILSTEIKLNKEKFL